MDRQVVEQKLESLRRCLAHETINWHIVHNIVKLHLADFTAFARAVSAQFSP
ncbi:MAG: hypothetical protein IPN06_09180 [Burkholderiales bacterium]|nr:hypothetical protein [Burkholderiales bacterium]